MLFGDRQGGKSRRERDFWPRRVALRRARVENFTSRERGQNLALPASKSVEIWIYSPYFWGLEELCGLTPLFSGVWMQIFGFTRAP